MLPVAVSVLYGWPVVGRGLGHTHKRLHSADPYKSYSGHTKSTEINKNLGPTKVSLSPQSWAGYPRNVNYVCYVSIDVGQTEASRSAYVVHFLL